ncbi:sugar phosphate isomerase/epimerase family protein [Rhodohalobacter sp. 614A]|uniref:sugar phosphate isomerase/epimerase family protein n=1 Tax=Rhodohalobacter sp. 614A TaxID=2908649 RepID=UPI001F3B0D16|nr:TIM barrel protein [Rhodohalobacter sp. 614A]
MNNNKKNKNSVSRRQFIGTSLSLATGMFVGAGSAFGAPAFIKNLAKPDSKIKGVQIGTITYSFRSMQDQSAEAILKAVVDTGISAVELMGDPAELYAGRPENPVDRWAYFSLMRKSRDEALTNEEQQQMEQMQAQMEEYNQHVAEWRSRASMDKFVELKNMFNDAGVSIYAWKPDAFNANSTDEEINYAFEAARALGAKSCTRELPEEASLSDRLGEIASKHEIYMGYHNHTQATPTLWDTALQQSQYNSMNLDIGHWVAAGNPSILDFIREKHDRITSIHVKDRQIPDNGAGNLVWGEGDTPIAEVLNLMSEESYSFPATVELEYQVPEGSNAVAEVKRCFEYCKNALNA